MKFDKKIILIFLIFNSYIFAFANIKITNFNTSYNVDVKARKAVNIEQNFKYGIKQIYASGIIHNIFPKTNFIINWYYYQNREKIPASKCNIGIVGTQFFSNSLMLKDKKPLYQGKYEVVLKYQDKIIAKRDFSIEKKKAITNNCNKPTQQSDAKIIDDLITLFKSNKESLKRLNFVRFFYKKRSNFSILVPQSWEKGTLKEKDIIFYAKKTTSKSKIMYTIERNKIPKEAKAYKPKKLLKLIANDVISKTKKLNKIILKPTVYQYPDIATLQFIQKGKINGIDVWDLEVLIDDEKYMYEISILTDRENLKTARFLSLLASYSFWSQEICKKSNKEE